MGKRRALKDLSALGDETRHSIFMLLHELDHPATAQDVAKTLNISPKLSRFHLETLLRGGLLRAHFARPPGRVGPGAGRTSKLYEPVAEEVHASIPPRDYELVASILVEALDKFGPTEDPKRTAVRVARSKGRRLAAEAPPTMSLDDLIDLLERVGYEPVKDKQGTIRLTNCPFHHLAVQDRPLVCSINKGFVEGLVSKIGSVKAKLVPDPSSCCVVLTNKSTEERK